MTITLRKAIAGLVAAGSLTLAGAAPALAGGGPANAPTTGTFDCTDTASGHPVASGNFVTNSGKSQVQTWTSAKMTFTSGLTGTGVFIQTGSNLLSGTTLSKGSHSLGPLQCLVWVDPHSGLSNPPDPPDGTVWGKIVTTG